MAYRGEALHRDIDRVDADGQCRESIDTNAVGDVGPGTADDDIAVDGYRRPG